jgi:competence protein ComEC
MWVIRRFDTLLLEQRGHLFPWAPVFMALGIGIYFLLQWEPGPATYAALAVPAGAALLIVWWRPADITALGWAVVLGVLGFTLAGYRAHSVAGPVLTWRYYGPVEGRVVALDRSSSDKLRVTLDQVRLNRVAPGDVPLRVRLSLHGQAADGESALTPGARIMTTGHLMPPQGPAEPGGFDFRRHAWFQKLGAVGYTRAPVLLADDPLNTGAGLRVFRLRMAASDRIRETLTGDTGGFAAAITTGDRSAVSLSAIQALRDSNLAHLLAISGLHMGLLAGFVFAFLRTGLALIPPLALRVPVRRLAAAGALVVATGYLLLSGGSVATERAYVMVAVALIAVTVDRRALSMRAVALAALVVLARRPETLLSPGFQMSFAATTALVGVFGWIRDAEFHPGPDWLRPVLGVVISSAVAGAATGPVGAAHFNTMAHYGLFANLVSVPLMGVLVIPAAVVALCLWPLGLDWIGLWAMGLGLDWTLGVAHFVASLDGARGFVPQPAPVVLPLIAFGFLFVILWQGRLRSLGLVPALAGFLLWSQSDRPAVLIDANGGLVGIMTDQGRALSKPRGAGFVARVWLENDGDGVDQPAAAARWVAGENPFRRAPLPGGELVHVIGQRAAAQFTECRSGQIIVSQAPLELSGPCDVYDPARLRRTGSLAIDKGTIRTAREITGDRLWNLSGRSGKGERQ